MLEKKAFIKALIAKIKRLIARIKNLLSKGFSAKKEKITLQKLIKQFGSKSTLEDILKLENFEVKIDRPLGYLKGSKNNQMKYPVNYGYIPGLKNPADKANWDILVPGVNKPVNKVKVSKIVGYIPMSSGNHKLIGLRSGATQINKDQVKMYLKRRIKQGSRGGSKHTLGEAVYTGT